MTFSPYIAFFILILHITLCAHLGLSLCETIAWTCGTSNFSCIRRLEEIFNKSGAALHMAFIVVTKRINTRLFMKGDNPAPGTIVDDVVTLPERYDFFLVSQSVRQGTVGPTSYHVLYDNLGLDPDKLQRLTYKMTHLYYNWSGTVRVPAACQYAHKLAVLTAQAVHQPFHKHLEDVLFFL